MVGMNINLLKVSNERFKHLDVRETHRYIVGERPPFLGGAVCLNCWLHEKRRPHNSDKREFLP